MRPPDLPDFERPPLREVVLGVQFSNPVGYLQIHAGEVWGLFRGEYPRVEEYQPLPPAFETFGNNLAPAGHQIAFLDGPLHDRYWFLRQDGSELIQFQQDRLLHNWRKVDDSPNAYPRFERMIEQFEREMRQLESYLSTLAPQELQINQCEVSYINQIAIDANDQFKISDWINFVNLAGEQPDGFSFSLRETLRDNDGSARARLTCEVSDGTRPGGPRSLTIALTVRGAPSAPTISSAVEFLCANRVVVVNKFTHLTTDKAHQIWRRTI